MTVLICTSSKLFREEGEQIEQILKLGDTIKEVEEK